MTQYIDKDALVEYIKFRYLEHQTGNQPIGCLDRMKEDKAILSYLNTLKVKEVDLEKEYDNYTKNILACDIQFEPFTHLHNCAKHFFELGLKSQKGE